MGEYAEMMLDGTCCSVCGEYLGGDDGYPTMCASCRRDSRNERQGAPQSAAGKVSCPQCGKRVKATGLADHARVVHGGAA